MSEQSPLSFADYLLSHIAQECAEVIVRITKAQHFGLDEVQPEQEYTNRERLVQELLDLTALVEVAQDEGILPFKDQYTAKRIAAKKLKAAKFCEYSQQLGRLAAPAPVAEKD